jgi:GTP cyclohydrolase I
VRELLIAVGEDPDRDGLRATPARVARMYAEVFAGLHADPDELLVPFFDEHHDELVIVKDIAVTSFCEHHLVPWTGTAAVGYIRTPTARSPGCRSWRGWSTSTPAARRAGAADRAGRRRAGRAAQPRGVIVVVEAEHLCMTVRGVRKPGARTVTSAVRGALKDSAVTRGEAMSLILAAGEPR